MQSNRQCFLSDGQNGNFQLKLLDIFFLFFFKVYSKHEQWVHIRTASTGNFLFIQLLKKLYSMEMICKYFIQTKAKLSGMQNLYNEN